MILIEDRHIVEIIYYSNLIFWGGTKNNIFLPFNKDKKLLLLGFVFRGKCS